MPARDVYHQAVKAALIKDGWVILAEDFVLEYGSDRLFADLAAEKTLAAERQGNRIIVEVKSFLGRSFIRDLEEAVGQYLIYRDILEETGSPFVVYLAVTEGIWKSNFQRDLAQMIIQRNHLKILIFDATRQEVVQWIR